MDSISNSEKRNKKKVTRQRLREPNEILAEEWSNSRKTKIGEKKWGRGKKKQQQKWVTSDQAGSMHDSVTYNNMFTFLLVVCIEKAAEKKYYI